MIPTALIIPSEAAPTAETIKRALLSFDAVRLLSPDDRGLVPDISAIQAVSPIPFPVGMRIRPLRPLGKEPEFDETFDKMLEAAKPAIVQGAVIIDQPPDEPGVVFGNYPLPADTPNPSNLYRIYLAVAAQQDFLELVASDVTDDRLSDTEIYRSVRVLNSAS